MDFDIYGGMTEDEYYYMESVNEAEEERLRQEKEEEEELSMLEEMQEDTSDQKKIKINTRMGYSGGGCLIALFSLMAIPIIIILAIKI